MLHKLKKAKSLICDCEGPLTKNDNAFEITKTFIPRGEHFFSLLSKYDDILADIVRKPGYVAGTTLKFITPFLIAYGVTNKKIKDYSSNNILLVPGAKELLQYFKHTIKCFIISTSYEQYILSLCSLIDFPFTNVYCTKLDLDGYRNFSGQQKLRSIKNEITSFPMINIPENAKSLNDFSEKDQNTIIRLNEIFWNEIPSMKLGRILHDVIPIGGEEKKEIIQEIVFKLGTDLGQIVYVGDSITDVQAFQLVRRGGGLTISFNGNRYAIKNVDIAVIADNAIVTSILVDAFFRYGKEYVLNMAKKWNNIRLEKYFINKSPIKSFFDYYPKFFSHVEVVNDHNVKRLIKDSLIFRQNFRGKEIGKLG